MSVVNRTADLLTALTTLCAQIDTDNGYLTDAGTRIDVEPVQITAGEAPRLCIGVDSVTVTDSGTGIRKRLYSILIEIALSTQAASAHATAVKALEDLLFRFHETTRITFTAPGVVADVTLADARVLNRPDGMPIAVAQARLDVQMQEPSA